MAGEVEAARAGEVDERGGAGGEGAMPQVDEIAAAGIAFFGMRENFFGLEVEEAHAHGAIAHDALKMADAAAAAEALLGIESDGDVAAFPNALDVGPATVANAVANGPDAGELVELTAGGGDTGSDGIGVVGDVDGGRDAFGVSTRVGSSAICMPLICVQIGRVFDDRRGERRREPRRRSHRQGQMPSPASDAISLASISTNSPPGTDESASSSSVSSG